MRCYALAVAIQLLAICTFVSVDNTNSADNACVHVRIWGKNSSCQCSSSGRNRAKVHCAEKNHFNGLEINNTDIDTLEFSNIELHSFNSEVSINANLKKLIFRKIQAKFLYLPWHHEFLLRSRGTLEMLEIYNCFLVFAWDISQIGDMERLTHLVIVGSPYYYAQFDINRFKSLEYLELRNANVEFLQEDQFSELRNLRLLSLSRNKIKAVERNMFPEPAVHLWHLDLSYNHLVELPDDIFTGMKKLKEIRLDHNELKTLPVRIFDSIAFHLKDLWMHDNSLNCSTERGWIEGRHLPAYTWTAQCILENTR